MLKKIIVKLLSLNRVSKQLIMVLIDSMMSVIVLLSSFSIRIGSLYFPKDEVFWMIFGAPLLAIPIFFSFGLYRSVTRFIGAKSLWSIAQSVTLYSMAWGVLAYMAALPMTSEGIPRSVILINWMFILIAVGGSRIFASWLFDEEKFFTKKNKSNVIIYGAGSEARQLSVALQQSSEYRHIAYVDEKLSKNRTYINNTPVFLKEDIEKLINKNDISEILIAMPSVSRKKRNEIIEELSRFSVRVRSLPSVLALAEGKVKIDDLLEIDVRDLLGRVPVKPNKKLLEVKINNKVVLVTGAGGSIGSELCRQIIYLNPKKIVLLDISEAALYLIEQELLKIDNLNVEVISLIGSISSQNQMTRILKFYNVETIYHAAAYKHVPLVEHNKAEGILNNSFGTLSLAKSAITADVETFVLISTDKAVKPTNVMGASKRIAELVLQAFAEQSHKTCFTMVRFGNVLESSGSVIPLFKKQIRAGGPITVTDPEIVRYFMTIPEAVELVIQAGAMGNGGDVFVLDMGKPVKILDLAIKMIQLSGLQVFDHDTLEGDIDIKFTGLRPGEKLYEELLVGDDVTFTDNKMIMRAREKMTSWGKLEPILDELKRASINYDLKKIQQLLLKIVPEYNSKSSL